MRRLLLVLGLCLFMSACQNSGNPLSFSERLPDSALFARTSERGGFSLTSAGNRSGGNVRGLTLHDPGHHQCLALTPECLGWDPRIWHVVYGNAGVASDRNVTAWTNVQWQTGGDGSSCNQDDKVTLRFTELNDRAIVGVRTYHATKHRNDNLSRKKRRARIRFESRHSNQWDPFVGDPGGSVFGGADFGIRNGKRETCSRQPSFPGFNWWAILNWMWGFAPPPPEEDCAESMNHNPRLRLNYTIRACTGGTMRTYTGERFLEFHPGQGVPFQIVEGNVAEIHGWTTWHVQEDPFGGYGSPILYDPFAVGFNFGP